MRVSSQCRPDELVVGLRQHFLPVQICTRFPPPRQIQKPGVVLLPRMCRGTRPMVDPRRPRHPRADGIALDIPKRRDRVRIVHRAGMEATLPQMPRAAMQMVDALREDEVCSTDREMQRVFPRRHGDEVDMVGHQAVAKHPHPVLAALCSQYVQIRDTIVIDKEHVLPIVSALSNMVSNTRNDYARLSRHGSKHIIDTALFKIHCCHGYLSSNRWLSLVSPLRA